MKESLQKAKEAVSLDVKDGTSWSESSQLVEGHSRAENNTTTRRLSNLVGVERTKPLQMLLCT